MLEAYLGDGVYAVYDGYNITLDLREQEGGIEIVLEPFVYDALVHFGDRCRTDNRPEQRAGSSDGYFENG